LAGSSRKCVPYHQVLCLYGKTMVVSVKGIAMTGCIVMIPVFWCIRKKNCP